ncbi:MAG: hypothetical protein AAF223_09015 [Bacteroidota bacterium]
MAARVGFFGITEGMKAEIVAETVSQVNASTQIGFTSGLVDVPAGGTANVNTGLVSINDVSVYRSGEDISDSVGVTISAPIIVISSNKSLTNITVKANGN